MQQKNAQFDIIPHGSFEFFFNQTEGMISLNEGAVLYELAKGVTDGCIIEVGAYRGRSTVALGRGSIDGHQVPVFSIEPHESFTGIYGGVFGASDRGAYYKAMLDSGCYHTVRLINASSESVSSKWKQEISLLWIDGDHTYEGVKRDYSCWCPFLKAEAIVAFDDSIDQGIGPYQLVNELVFSEGYSVIMQVEKVTVLQRR